MAVALAILSVLGPALAPLLVMWAERYAAKAQRRSSEEIDEHITQHLKGNPAGLIVLSQRLERLHREASRKRGDTR